MLNEEIKTATKSAHQQLEVVVIRELKSIRSDEDYAQFLKKFHIYFQAIEQLIAPFLTPEVLPDYAHRRNSKDLAVDIHSLGSELGKSEQPLTPKIENTLDALSALYVLEGSIMGGPIIVQMLQKNGISKGFSFFSGYGAETGTRWNAFIEVLNRYGADPATNSQAIAIANETFEKFGLVFKQEN
ncbi:biliverdin-producing heme oxygenase [Sphingobacterium hungaricum]|uniref:Heme oxygenase n=1 Tax=Sphingobacterium hungaricum TaxID=2082723 RepID=A0A928YPC3_9SPHI|nr:biliverdin-producing heme oxygenase [Sphingobacterium hungaricum]MBE8712784.1 heme oxygenase [Sphingobacterium hungaricum]